MLFILKRHSNIRPWTQAFVLNFTRLDYYVDARLHLHSTSEDILCTMNERTFALKCSKFVTISVFLEILHWHGFQCGAGSVFIVVFIYWVFSCLFALVARRLFPWICTNGLIVKGWNIYKLFDVPLKLSFRSIAVCYFRSNSYLQTLILFRALSFIHHYLICISIM